MPTTRTTKPTPRERESSRPASRAPTRRSDGRRAATRVGRGTRLEVPVLGTVTLPCRDQLVFYGGLGLLAVVGVIEWPVAAVVGAGHLLAAKRNNKALREVGEALEQA
jgi:hypothetical protein